MTELTYVSYRNGYFRKKAGTKVRPVPEMGLCLVYTPEDPNLYTLNATSWLILELCEGATYPKLERAYWKEANEAYDEDAEGGSPFVAPPRPVKSHLRKELIAGLSDLEQRRVIEFVATA